MFWPIFSPQELFEFKLVFELCDSFSALNCAVQSRCFRREHMVHFQTHYNQISHQNVDLKTYINLIVIWVQCNINDITKSIDLWLLLFKN